MPPLAEGRLIRRDARIGLAFYPWGGYYILASKNFLLSESEPVRWNYMMAELRTKSQITIPKGIVSKLGLAQGDKFDVFERDGVIHLVPVAVYPKQYVDELEKEVAVVRARLKDGTQPKFSSVDDMINTLEKK